MPSALNRPTLVLNRNWQPIHVASVQRAVTLLYDGRAQVVDPEDYQLYAWDDWQHVVPERDDLTVRSTSVCIKAPDVVVLANFDQLPRVTVTYSKRNVFKRDRFTCQYCGHQPGRDELTIDHVVPRSRGGETGWENCVLACLTCNRKKANKSLAQAGVRLRQAPKRPTWQPLYASLTAVRESWTKFLGDLSQPAMA